MEHTPTDRIRRVLERAGVHTRRSPRWVEEAGSGHIARMDEVRRTLTVR